jgi:pyruvoyl-dependent arginine decarboxylase
MRFIPTDVWAVVGKGESDTSKMCAFDAALYDAEIGICNLVVYSSKMPADVKWRDFREELVPGQELKVILARTHGTKGQKIASGIGIAETDDYPIVTEVDGKSTPEEAEKQIKDELTEMAEIASLKIKSIKTWVSNTEVKKKHGCVLSLIIYNPNNYR